MSDITIKHWLYWQLKWVAFTEGVYPFDWQFYRIEQLKVILTVNSTKFSLIVAYKIFGCKGTVLILFKSAHHSVTSTLEWNQYQIMHTIDFSPGHLIMQINCLHILHRSSCTNQTFVQWIWWFDCCTHSLLRLWGSGWLCQLKYVGHWIPMQHGVIRNTHCCICLWYRIRWLP